MKLLALEGLECKLARRQADRPASRREDQLKIYISSDMEGTAGVVDWSQCLPGERDYEHYRRLLQSEVNAAIDGAMAAGPRRSSATTRTGR